MLQLAIKAQCCATPVNADGFGISWYIPDVHVPGVFKDITPGTCSIYLHRSPFTSVPPCPYQLFIERINNQRGFILEKEKLAGTQKGEKGEKE